MKFKGLLILGMFLILMSIQKGYSWSLIVHSPKIYGQVVDSVTGQPIENAIVSVVYYKDVPAIVDRTSKVFASYVYITDKEGKFTVPAKTSFHMPPLLIVGSWFAGRNVTINHPLYESTPTLTGECRIKITKNVDGSLGYAVDLISLEEKIEKSKDEYEKTNNIWKTFNFGSFLSGYSGNFLKRFYSEDYIEMVLAKWKEIAEKYCKNNGQVQDEIKRLDKEIKDLIFKEN